MQRQVGVNDRALFAKAFATSLCLREDPFTKMYLQSAMREHFLECCEKKKILPFPSSPQPRRLGRQK